MATPDEAPRSYKYYDLVMAAFVTVLLCSNLIGAAKACQVHVFGYAYTFTAGVLYGYARARKVVWSGFGALLFSAFMIAVVLRFPPAPGWTGQVAIESVFGSTWRIILASLVAYFAGEFCNSFVLAKMKILTNGRYLWMRTIGSTIVGEAVDSLIFYPMAFLGLWPRELVLQVMLGNYLLKVGWEVVNTPVTYRVVNFLKRAEREDYYDRDTNFTPFSLET
jgi:queuosine precursor transporter